LLWEVFTVIMAKVIVLSAFPALAQHICFLDLDPVGPKQDKTMKMNVEIKNLSQVRVAREMFNGPHVTKAHLEGLAGVFLSSVPHMQDVPTGCHQQE
jgi:hypothetical protein